MLAPGRTISLIIKDMEPAARREGHHVAYAKANPGKVSLGHAGVGSSNYLICRSFIMASGVEVNLASDPIPLVKLPGLSVRLGAARILDEPLEDENRFWLGLAWRP